MCGSRTAPDQSAAVPLFAMAERGSRAQSRPIASGVATGGDQAVLREAAPSLRTGVMASPRFSKLFVFKLDQQGAGPARQIMRKGRRMTCRPEQRRRRIALVDPDLQRRQPARPEQPADVRC